MPRTDVHGILNVNKPAGKTSFRIVALVRRWSGVSRVGHTGTLDPQATGVLLVCLGQATRVAEYLVDAGKVYLAEIELGICTDTYDASGRVIERADPTGVTREQVQSVLPSFVGTIWQTPPLYSALKFQGKPLYQLARAGQCVELAPRQVSITSLELLDWHSPRFFLKVECGKGTYIRSLAHDIGQALGCGAHLASLVRTRVGKFSIEEAVTLSQLEEAFHDNRWSGLLHPVDKALEGMKAATVDSETERRIRNGQPVPLAIGEPNAAPPMCRAYALDGRFIAVLRLEPIANLWQPEKVFPEPLAGNEVHDDTA